MSIERPILRLPRPHDGITDSYVDQLCAALEEITDILNATRQRNFTYINLTNTATNGSGLRVGDVYSDNGTLKIVQAGVGYAAPFSATGAVGTVTVVTT